MAKPTGGLLAFSARGTVAKTITFASWRGRQYVRQHVIPANPRSSGQTETRNTFIYLSDTWKQMPALLQAVWTLAAKGQPVTDRNLWVKANLAPLRGAVNIAGMTFSNGAKGGLAPFDMTLTPGVTQITADVVAPALPPGWTIHSAIVTALNDAVPGPVQPILWAAGEDLTSTYQVVLTGLQTGVLYYVSSLFRFVKPDGSPAYGISITQTATPT